MMEINIDELFSQRLKTCFTHRYRFEKFQEYRLDYFRCDLTYWPINDGESQLCELVRIDIEYPKVHIHKDLTGAITINNVITSDILEQFGRIGIPQIKSINETDGKNLAMLLEDIGAKKYQISSSHK